MFFLNLDRSPRVRPSVGDLSSDASFTTRREQQSATSRFPAATLTDERALPPSAAFEGRWKRGGHLGGGGVEGHYHFNQNASESSSSRAPKEERYTMLITSPEAKLMDAVHINLRRSPETHRGVNKRNESSCILICVGLLPFMALQRQRSLV